MSSQAEQLETLGLMAAHEAAMADLYSAYAARFPESADLFTTLATAERDHARRLTDFAAAVRAGEVRVPPGRFPPAMVLSSLDFVQQQIRDAQLPDLTLAASLSIAYDLENGLIESRYFDVVEGDSPELRELVERMASELAEHRDMVREALEKERQHSL